MLETGNKVLLTAGRPQGAGSTADVSGLSARSFCLFLSKARPEVSP
jgi:hypothetical protein